MGKDASIFLDESGDLGWNFDRPYQNGGSSRYLTIGAIVVPTGLSKYLTREIRSLYRTRKWAPGKEKKWSGMRPSARLDFATRAAHIQKLHEEIAYHTITVKKERVQEHIRIDANKLYNWMIKDFLLVTMAQFETVRFLPDERSVKVRSGNSLHDYLQAELWLTLGAKTKLTTIPSESSKHPQLQFVDMLCGTIQSHFENSDSDPFNILSSSVIVNKMFF